MGWDQLGCLSPPVSAFRWCVPKEYRETGPATLNHPLLKLAGLSAPVCCGLAICRQVEVIQVAGQVDPTRPNNPAPWYLTFRKSNMGKNLCPGVFVHEKGTKRCIQQVTIGAGGPEEMTRSTGTLLGLRL